MKKISENLIPFIVLFILIAFFSSSYLFGYLLIEHCNTKTCNYNPLTIQFIHYMSAGVFFNISILIDFGLLLIIINGLKLTKCEICIFIIISLTITFFLSFLIAFLIDKEHNIISSETFEWFPITYGISILFPFVVYTISYVIKNRNSEYVNLSHPLLNNNNNNIV